MLIAAVAAAATISGPALAREGAWMSIGIRPMNATTATQTIEVDAASVNVAREAMICADDSNIQIVTAEFRFRNGDSQTVNVRGRVRAGDCSPTVSLRNRDQELASVTITANPTSIAAGATARVRVLVH